MASQCKASKALKLLLALLLANSINTVVASVPPSVAVRQQAAPVEELISKLELNATAASGRWTSKSGRQDEPADGWATTVQARQWSWKSLGPLHHTDSVYSVYCDGDNCFSLPDAVRFQNDTLAQGKFEDFRLSHYLLLLNLQPRQFIGSLGELQSRPDVTIDGVACAHLSTDLAKDPMLKKDPSVRERSALRPRIDLYIDRQREAVVEVCVNDPSGYRVEVVVDAWDNFGTSATWPKKWTARTLIGGDGSSREIDKPYLTSVEEFKSGISTDIADLQKAVELTACFSAPLDNLRTAAFYQHEVDSNPNDLSDRVALAQASFNEANVARGLEAWNSIEGHLTAVADRAKLQQVIVPHATYALWTPPKTNDQLAAYVAVMQKLLGDLSAAELKFNCLSLYVGWETLYTNPKNRPSLEPINGRLLEVFSADGDPTVFSRMVALGHKKEYQTTITRYLDKVVAQPLPAAGYSGAPASYIIAAYLQEGNLTRSKECLQHVTWNPQSSVESNAIVADLLAAMDQVVALDGNGSDNLSPVIESFAKCSSGKDAKDRVTAQAITQVLVAAGAKHLDATLTGEGRDTASALRATAKLDGAAPYWNQVIQALVPIYGQKPDRLIAQIGPLFKLYGQVFGQAQYEPKMWIALARAMKGYLGIQVEYLNRGLTAASDDATRFDVVRELGLTYSAVREYAAGAQAVEGALQQLKDPAFIQRAQKLRDNLLTSAAKQIDQASAHQKEIDRQNYEHELAMVQDQLEAARKRGASAGDIASLERTVNSIRSNSLDRPAQSQQ